METHLEVVPRSCQTHAHQLVEEARRETFYRIAHHRPVNCQPDLARANVPGLASALAKTVPAAPTIARSGALIWLRIVPTELTTDNNGKVIGKHAMPKFATRLTRVIRTAAIGTTTVSGEAIRTHGGGSVRASTGGDLRFGPR